MRSRCSPGRHSTCVVTTDCPDGHTRVCAAVQLTLRVRFASLTRWAGIGRVQALRSFLTGRDLYRSHSALGGLLSPQARRRWHPAGDHRHAHKMARIIYHLAMRHELYAREVGAIGFRFMGSPVVDINRPDNPIVSTRAFGEQPDVVTRMALTYAEGVQGEGVRRKRRLGGSGRTGACRRASGQGSTASQSRGVRDLRPPVMTPPRNQESRK